MEQNIDNKKITNTNVKDIIIGIIPLCIAIIIEVFFKLCNGGFEVLFSTNEASLIYSIMLIYILYIFFLSITKKNSTSIKIILIISYIILIINQIKILYVGEPIVFSDLNFIERVGDIATLTLSTMATMILPYVIGFIILGLIFIFIAKWVKNNEKTLNSSKIRISAFVACSLLLLLLFIPNKYTKDFYLNLFFNADKHTDYGSYTTNLTYYQQYTLLSGIWGVMLNNNFTEPQNYDELELSNILQNTENETQKELRTT